MDDPTVPELERLADVLWAERHVTELVLYRLTLAKLVLVADERRFVSLAVGEVDSAVDSLREAELRRGAAVSRLAEMWGADPRVLTLAVLAERAPEPFASVLADHREAFRKLTEEIEEAAGESHRLASAGLQRVRRSLRELTSDRSDPAPTAARGARRRGTPGRPDPAW